MTQDILKFIKWCINSNRMYWTYHINMRLKERHISRDAILGSVESFEIIESYPEDKYLPSYLIYAEPSSAIIHVHIAVDSANKNIRIITAYKPTMDKWENDYRTRRKPR